jgi:hypothetical protein
MFNPSWLSIRGYLLHSVALVVLFICVEGKSLGNSSSQERIDHSGGLRLKDWETGRSRMDIRNKPLRKQISSLMQ